MIQQRYFFFDQNVTELSIDFSMAYIVLVHFDAF